MAIFGARGIRDSIRKAYRKHLTLYEGEPESGIPPHHSALHGALTLRYAASYRARPAALVWLELGPFLALAPESAVEALAEYVVYRERPKLADEPLLRRRVRDGLEALAQADREWFLSAAQSYRFPWLRLVGSEKCEV